MHEAVAEGAQHLDGREHAFGVLALDAERLLVMCPDGDVDGIEVATQLAQGHVVGNGRAHAQLDALRDDPVDLAFELGARKAVGGDAVTHHAAQVLTLLEHDGGVPHEREVVRGGETGRSAADDGDALSGGGVVEGRRRRDGAAIGIELEHLRRVIHRIALERADVDGVVHHAAPARELAGMLADEAAGKREGVVLADKAHGVVVAAGVDQGDVAGNVDVSGARRAAGHGIARTGRAAPLRGVGDEVVAEALHGPKHHGSGLVADGAVGAQVGVARCALEHVDVALAGAAIEDGLHEVAHLGKPHAAGDAFAARLRGGQADERIRELDGAGAHRSGLRPACDRVAHVLHDGMRCRRAFDFD